MKFYLAIRYTLIKIVSYSEKLETSNEQCNMDEDAKSSPRLLLNSKYSNALFFVSGEDATKREKRYLFFVSCTHSH